MIPWYLSNKILSTIYNLRLKIEFENSVFDLWTFTSFSPVNMRDSIEQTQDKLKMVPIVTSVGHKKPFILFVAFFITILNWQLVNPT